MKKRSLPPQQSGGGNLLFDILTIPILGAPRMVCWIGEKLIEAVEQGELDEGKLQAQLLGLQMRYELSEISEEEYAEQEAAILNRLDLVRRAKEQD